MKLTVSKSGSGLFWDVICNGQLISRHDRKYQAKEEAKRLSALI